MNAQNYAEALWKTVERGNSPKEAVRHLIEILREGGRDALVPGILRALRRIQSREKAQQTVILGVAKEADLKRAEKEASEYLKNIGAERSEVVGHVEPDLIGGWRLEGKETLVDASFKKQLQDMYNAATMN